MLFQVFGCLQARTRQLVPFVQGARSWFTYDEKFTAGQAFKRRGGGGFGTAGYGQLRRQINGLKERSHFSADLSIVRVESTRVHRILS